MGILRKRHEKNILTENGFEYKKNSAGWHLTDCYEIFIPINDTYCAYVAVKPETKHLAYYIEYECGGEVSSGCYSVSHFPSFEDNPEGFFDALDEEVTGLVDGWNHPY